jgi:hypothetical protein
VPYGPRLEPRSEVNKEATKKRRNDAGAGPAGKCAKVSGSKVAALKDPVVPKGSSAASPKAPTTPKGPSVASSKAASSHARSVPKADALPKTSASPKAAVPKSAVTQAVPTQVVPKAGVLKISNKGKMPVSVEPLLASKGKQGKVNVVPSSGSAPIHGAIVRLQPPTEFDDGRVVAYAMLGASSVVSSLASSSSDF